MVILHGGHWSCTVKLREASQPFLRLREQNEEILNMMTGKLRKVCTNMYIIYIYTVYDYIILMLYMLKLHILCYTVIHVSFVYQWVRRDHL